MFKSTQLVMPVRKNIEGLIDPESKRAAMAYNEALEDVELLIAQHRQTLLSNERESFENEVRAQNENDPDLLHVGTELFTQPRELPHTIIDAYRAMDAIPSSPSNFDTPEIARAKDRVIDAVRAAITGK